MNITVERSNGITMQIMPDGTQQMIQGTTDWSRLKAMSDEEIELAALADADNPPLTEAELKKFKRVPNPKEIRQHLQLTQQQFATQFELPLGILKDWEQGISELDSTAKAYLRVIAKNPQAVIQALHGQ